MSLNINQRFENHMDVAKNDRLAEAEVYNECEDDDLYDDALDEKMDNDEFNTSTSIDGKVIELEKAKLSDYDKNSFRDGNYRTVEAKEDMVLYRVYGEGAGKQGAFLTTEEPIDRMATKMESALPTKIDGNNRWTNSRQFYCEVSIPKGTVMNIGKVAPQETKEGIILPGGADQVLLSRDFVEKNPNNFGKEYELGFSGGYKQFDEIAKKLECK